MSDIVDQFLNLNLDSFRKIVEERDEYKAALEGQWNVNTEHPLFDGLVGGSFPPGSLLATCHRLQGELDETKTYLMNTMDSWHRAKQERDEAREAARFLIRQMDDMELTRSEAGRWPWLEETE